MSVRLGIYLVFILLPIVGFSQTDGFNLKNRQFYQHNLNLIDSPDTLILKSVITNYSFRLWHFKENVLTISSGTLRKNNPNAKCFNEIKYYQWELKTHEDVKFLILTFGDSEQYYIIDFLDSNKIMLVESQGNILNFEEHRTH